MTAIRDDERNRLSARALRYARVGAGMGGVAARMAASRLLGGDDPARGQAAALAQTLGGLKGPMMKVAQLLATIPDALPPAYAEELMRLQSDAPPMGAAFVMRRMQAELGLDWRRRFQAFDLHPSAAASLGQVHRAHALDGRPLACKLQYPDMRSAVEADLSQLEVIFALHRRMSPAIDTRDVITEIGARIREELDYKREARHAALYAAMLNDRADIRVPGVWSDLSTDRLLTLDWMDGAPLLSFKNASQAERNRIAAALFNAWWLPFSRFGVIHGDPHLGNYTVFRDGEDAGGLNLLDYGCVRIFPPRFVGGVVELYRGLQTSDPARIMHAYEIWGFRHLAKDIVEALNVWARFIYGPLLDDRVRSVADGVAPGQYGRREAFSVMKTLKEKGPVRVPQEFVFMDRAAIGLGGVFLHLGAELNFHQMFEAALGDAFSVDQVAQRQAQALAAAGLA